MRLERVAQPVARLAEDAVEVLGVDAERSVLAHRRPPSTIATRRVAVDTSVRVIGKFATTTLSERTSW